jgi:hypothetical protein
MVAKFVAMALTLVVGLAGCGDATPDSDLSPTTQSSGVDAPDTYNDEDNDGKAPAEG